MKLLTQIMHPTFTRMNKMIKFVLFINSFSILSTCFTSSVLIVAHREKVFDPV
jgi:hypothetical protein